jgi:hypothetical protein
MISGDDILVEWRKRYGEKKSKNHNTEKIDETTLALLCLVTWRQRPVVRAWKSLIGIL